MSCCRAKSRKIAAALRENGLTAQAAEFEAIVAEPVTADLAWKEVEDAKGHRWVGVSKDTNLGFHIVEFQGPGIPLYRIQGLLADGTPIKHKRQVKTVKEAQQIVKKLYDALASDPAYMNIGDFGWSKA